MDTLCGRDVKANSTALAGTQKIMKREVVQDFLNLPGIAGLALMDGRSRPYFYGIDQSLNFQQKEALIQGIQQVIDTTPSDFEFFQFQFGSRQIYIYKLDHGIILLILTIESLTNASHTRVVEQLKLELQQDAANAIATFRLLAGSTTLSGQNYWKQGTNTAPTSASTQPTQTAPLPSVVKTPPPTPTSEPIALNPSPSDVTFSLPAPQTISQPPVPSIAIRDVLAAMNHLSQYATQYLGATVVTNYWKTTRPSVDWLAHFQVERSAQITAPDPQVILTAEQHQWFRDWVAAFVERCARVIRDFPKTVKTILDNQQKSLLFSHSS